MGAWGTGIFDNDTTCDVRDELLAYLGDGKSVEEATRIILDDYLGEFDEVDDLELISWVYIGLSATQLHKGCLLEDVRNKAIEIIDRGADLELWQEADEIDYKERKKALEQFKKSLQQFAF